LELSWHPSDRARRLRALGSVLVVCAMGACSAPRTAAPPPAPRSQGDETDQIIDALLSDMKRVEAGTAPNSTGERPTRLNSNADSFDEDRARIRASVSQWEQGSGVALRFVKQSTGERLSLIFVDETAPGHQPETNMWMIQATARVDGGKVVGHFVLFLKDLRAGHYRGDDHSKDAIMAVLMGQSKWDGENPETAWSVNSESWCEVRLHAPDKSGLEGDLRARLVDNRGSGYIQVESGYLFIKR
jgi:hypothetical protein